MKNSSPPLRIQNPNHIDWKDQWARFAPGFQNGKAHIDLTRFGVKKTLLLYPGPGFGDLSHPTTSLMLSCMEGEMQDRIALDIGCGSGILSLAALLMGASRSIGIDIDEEAILHARQNAKLNQLRQSTNFARTLPKRSRGIVLINMILSEQKLVLKEIPDLPRRASLWIASGILVEQKQEAQDFAESLGLQFLEEKKEGEWIAMKFKEMRESQNYRILRSPRCTPIPV